MSLLLPKWNGDMIGAMHRIGITEDAVAGAMGVTRTYLSRQLNSPKVSSDTKAKIENAIAYEAMKRGFSRKDVL